MMTTARPGILFISPWMHDGGVERVLQVKVPWFAERGYRVAVVAWEITESPGGRPNPVLETFQRLGIPFRRLPAYTGRLHLTQRALRVAALALRQRYRIFVGHETMGNLVAILAKRILRGRVRAIGELHNAIVRHRTGFDPLTLERTRRLYRDADGMIAVSEAVRRDALEFFRLAPPAVRTIYTPFRPDDIRRLAEEPAPLVDGAGPFIVGCGRLVPMKGFDDLLRGFALARRARRFKLVILGEGPERRALGRLAHELGVADDVIFAGFVGNPFQYFARARAFVLASRFGEALPRVMIEAMACGTPVIASRCRWGPEEILQDGRYGQLFDVGAVEQLAAAITRTFERPDEIAAQAAAARLRADGCAEDVILPRMERYYLGSS